MLKRFSFVQCIFFFYSLISLKSVRWEGFMAAGYSWPLCLPHWQLSAGTPEPHLSTFEPQHTSLSLSCCRSPPLSLSLSLSCTHSPPLSALFLPWTPTNSHCVSVLLTWLLSPLVNQHKKSCPVLFPHYTYSTYCLSLIILLSLTTANPPPLHPTVCLPPSSLHRHHT